MSTVSESLISLTKNERPRAICSGRSEEMSDVSESLILLTKNERMSEPLIFWVNRSFAHFLTKTSDSLGNQMSEFPALLRTLGNVTATLSLHSLNYRRENRPYKGPAQWFLTFSYLQVREYCGLPKISSFAEFNNTIGTEKWSVFAKRSLKFFLWNRMRKPPVKIFQSVASRENG